MNQATTPATAKCISTGTQCQIGSVSMRCDDATDCTAGNVCCGYWTGVYVGTIQCQGESNCEPPMNAGAGDYPICDYPGGDCPPSMSCHEEPLLGPGHGYCY